MIPASRIETLARAAFGAYVRPQGREAPTWDALDPCLRESWRRAVRAVAEAIAVSP
jgi:hypothetical protein